MSEETVEYFYSQVRSHLERIGLWERVIRRFPPGAIRAAVRRIVERFEENYLDPAVFDWGAAFEALVDYESIDDFIRDLERKRLIPPSAEELTEAYVPLLEAQVSELLTEIQRLPPRERERLRSAILASLGVAEELERLRAELRRAREAARRARLVREYEAQLARLRGELARARAEAEQLRRRLEEAPWRKPPFTRFMEDVVSALVEAGVPRGEAASLAAQRRAEMEEAYAAIVDTESMYRYLLSAWRDRLLREWRRRRAPPGRLSRAEAWRIFERVLREEGAEPERGREQFETEWREVISRLGRREAERHVEAFAREVARELRPPPPVAPPARPPAAPSAEEIRRIVREEIERAYKPVTREEIRAATEALIAVEPRFVRRVDPAGHVFTGPDDATLAALSQMLPDARLVQYFSVCPACRLAEVNWTPDVLFFGEQLIKNGMVPPMFVPWFKRFIDMYARVEGRA